MPVADGHQNVMSGEYASVVIAGEKYPVVVAVGADGEALTISIPGDIATETTLAAVLAALAAPVVVDGSGVTQPVSAATLPLPAGAAEETTLAAQSAKLPATLGQKAMSASMAVALASDQASIPVHGNVAHDAVDLTRGPIKIGGRATSSEPAAVGNNDRVRAYFDLNGYQRVKLGASSGTAIGTVAVSNVAALPTAFGQSITDATTISSLTTWGVVFDISTKDVTTLSSVGIIYTGDTPIVLSSKTTPSTSNPHADEEVVVPPYSAFTWPIATANDIQARMETTVPLRGSLYLNGAGV